MTLFPRSERVLRFTELPHLELTSRRILDARDLTNGINAVMIDCMHGVTAMRLQPSISRELRTVHKSRAESWLARFEGPRLLVLRYHESP